MKTILAIETSTSRGGVALVRGAEVMFEREFVADRSHNSLVFEPIEGALAVAPPDLIVVGTGPGSYTGVRIGLAAGIGLSLARGIPLAGWPSLCAFDAPENCLVTGNARRGAYFLAELKARKLASPPELFSLDELRERLRTPAFTLDEAPFPLPNVQPVCPSARLLAHAMAQLSDTELGASSAVTPEPIYLRAPFTTTAKVTTLLGGGR